MSIFVTTAPNDADLIPLVGNLAVPAPIPSGDFAFFGVWHGGEQIRVCGDRKKLWDLWSCVTSTGRYMEQLRRAKEAGFNFLVLIFEMEPQFKLGYQGLIEKRAGAKWFPVSPTIEYKRIDQYLNELHYYMNVQVKISRSPRETAKQIIDLYLLFQDEPVKHHSLKQFFTPAEPVVDLYHRPSLVRRVAKELKLVGWDKSKAIEEHFGSVAAMATAGVRDWEQIPGIGKKIAKEAVEEINKDWRAVK